MCLSVAINNPENVLNKGEHEGFEWVVTHNGLGSRCGYVRVPPGHPWHGEVMESWDESHPDVHGGITFTDPDVPCDAPGEDKHWWLGFDCAHAGDAPDPDLPGRMSLYRMDEDVIRTQEYVEAECRSLCEQALAIAPAPKAEAKPASCTTYKERADERTTNGEG